jgi:diguanylate cyclase (GGDEF)-like protein
MDPNPPVSTTTPELGLFRERFTAVLDSLDEGVLVLNSHGAILDVNARAVEVLGVLPGPSQDWWSRLAPTGEDGRALPAPPWQAAPGSDRLLRNLTVEASVVDGTRRCFIVNTLNVSGSALQPEGTVLAFRDVTDHRATQQRLDHVSLHDGLTGLPNRTLLLDRIEHALERAVRHRRSVAVILVDLDHFKVLNDSLGFEAGDEVLLETASRLSAVMRPGDTLARVGADEFVAVLEDVSSTEEGIAAAHRLLGAFTGSFRAGGGEQRVTASAGVAVAEPASEAVLAAHTMLRDADAAMHRAKALGRRRCEVFDDEVRRRAVLRQQVDAALRSAIERDELRLAYQPVVDLATGRMVGAEALLRWPTAPDALGPAEFVPIAEESGMINPIGSWVLREACTTAMTWHGNRTESALHIGVNVSARQLNAPWFPDLVAQVLTETGIPPHQLMLELTESALIGGRVAIDVLHRLKDLGVRLALDDFGVGYSAMGYLHELPLDYLKLDQSFVAKLDRPDGSRQTAVVAAAINLASALDMTVIAEGVEREGQADRLRGLGCTLAQGFHFAKPLSVTQLAGVLSTQELTRVS